MKVVYTIYYVKVGGIVSCKAPAKRSQHVNTTYRTLLGATCCVRLATVLRCVATSWVSLAQV